MTHYLVIQGVQLDGHPFHPSGELSYLAEFSPWQMLQLVASGAVEQRDGAIPDAPPPPPPPEPEPEPEPEPKPLMLGTWTGTGEPPKGTWQYYHQHGTTGLDDEPLVYLVGDTVVDNRPKAEADDEGGDKPRRKRPAKKDGN